MSSENKTNRWNRFEIGFNARNHSQTARAKEAWRRNFDETGSGAEMDKTPPKNRFAEKTTRKKGPLASSPSCWNDVNPKVDAETKERLAPPFKSVKSKKFARKSQDCPFPRRPRTFRSSEPPRRFDDPRKD